MKRIAPGVAAALALAVVPLVASNFWTGVAISVLIHSCVFLSITVLTGYVGQVSLCQASLMGVGAFAAGLCANRLGLPAFVAVPLCGLVTVPFSMLIGLPALRLRGLSLAVVSLLFSTTMASLVFRNDDIIGKLTVQSFGADDSITGLRVPRPAWGDDLLSSRAFFWITLAFLLGLIVIIRNVREGRTGRVLIAVRENDDAVLALGSSVVKAKLTAFALSAFAAGVGGALFAYRSGTVSWIDFDTFRSIFFFALAAVAGIDSVPGAILAAGLLILPPEILTNVGASSFNRYSFLVSGVLLVVTTLALPRGLARTGELIKAQLATRAGAR